MKDSVSWIWSRWKQINIWTSQTFISAVLWWVQPHTAPQQMLTEYRGRIATRKKRDFSWVPCRCQTSSQFSQTALEGQHKKETVHSGLDANTPKVQDLTWLGHAILILFHDASQWYCAWPSRRKAWSFLYDWPEWCQRKEQEYTQGPVDTICRLDLMHNNVVWCRKMM